MGCEQLRRKKIFMRVGISMKSFTKTVIKPLELQFTELWERYCSDKTLRFTEGWNEKCTALSLEHIEGWES